MVSVSISNRESVLFFGRLLLTISTACLGSARVHAEAPARPNILWLIAENIGLDVGCFGEQLVRTPHLDRLAADGMRFTHVFATSPSCAPSRSAFFTGIYQTATDTHAMRSHRSDDFRLPLG